MEFRTKNCDWVPNWIQKMSVGREPTESSSGLNKLENTIDLLTVESDDPKLPNDESVGRARPA